MADPICVECGGPLPPGARPAPKTVSLIAFGVVPVAYCSTRCAEIGKGATVKHRPLPPTIGALADRP